MKQNLLFIISLFMMSLGLNAQIIYNKTDEFFGEIKEFNNLSVEFQCLNKYNYPIAIGVESMSENIEVKLISDTIAALQIFKVNVNVYPVVKGSLKEKFVLKTSDGTKKEFNINGYISSFSSTYLNSIFDNQLSSEKEIIFMIVDGRSQKVIPYAKVYISNIYNHKNFIGYSDQFGILKNRIPEGRYLLQSLTTGYKRDIQGTKIDPALNMAMVLLDKAQLEEKPIAQEILKPNSPLEPPSESKKIEEEKIGLDSSSISENPSPAAVNVRRPLNMIMLIDNSSSMGAEGKMEKVKATIFNLIDNYNPEDQMAILTFNEQVNTITPSIKVSSLSSIHQKINSIAISGKTNGEEGINKAFEMMEDIANKEFLNMIVLATDGRIVNSSYVEHKILKKIEEMNQKGYLLSVMGFTSSAFHSKKMQQMADIGGGIYLNMNDHKENYNSVLLEEIYKTLLKIDQ